MRASATARTAARAERNLAGARGDVAATTTEALLTAADIVAYNAIDTVLDDFSRRDAHLAAAERGSAWSAGLGSALLVVCVGGASIAALVLGSTANITGAVFAVLVLTPLALADVDMRRAERDQPGDLVLLRRPRQRPDVEVQPVVRRGARGRQWVELQEGAPGRIPQRHQLRIGSLPPGRGRP